MKASIIFALCALTAACATQKNAAKTPIVKGTIYKCVNREGSVVFTESPISGLTCVPIFNYVENKK